MYNRNMLMALIRERALKFGQFTLASGKEASYYLDCRQVTLSGLGANLIAEGFLDLMGRYVPDAVGGMAIGADPITAAIITLGSQRDLKLNGFIVRKEEKAHGTGRNIEGPVDPGQDVVIVEDVLTTGGSALKAIEAAQQFGLRVRGVIAIIDRLEGGREALEPGKHPLRTLFTVRDFGIQPA